MSDMKDKIININSDSFEQNVLKSSQPVVVYFYSEDCPPCIALEAIFVRMAQNYGEHMRFVKIFRQRNRELAESYNVKSSPTLLFFRSGQEVCARLSGYIGKPEIRQSIEKVLGEECPLKIREKVYCDVLILGGGPAGLSAAMYAGRAKLQAVVVDESMPGGQVATSFHVANYPGTNGVIRGTDLAENMKRQAVDFGARIDDMKEVFDVSLYGEEKYVKTDDTDYYAKSVIIATGAAPRKLPAEGEREFRGRGVHYCATCDGAMYQDADILVVGGGNSAVEEAVFLTRYAKHVTIIHQFANFQASKASQDEALKNPNISVVWDSEVRKVLGENFVNGAFVENVKTGEKQEIKTSALFVYIGMEPKTGLFKGIINLNDQGYIIGNEEMQTNISGVFAAGDVREKNIRQIATAVNDGVIAGLMAERYINRKM